MAHHSDSSSDSPPLSPASKIRQSWDEHHYKSRDHELLSSDVVRYKDETDNEIVFERPRSSTKHTIPVQELRPDDCRLYCFRDCVLYFNCHPPPQATTADRLGQTVWTEWFPHRDMDRDVADGNFFCRYMRLSPHRKLAGIIDFHQTLCERLRSQEASIERKEVPTTLEVEQEVPFRLRPTFSSIFVVVGETDWKQHGVLVAYKDASVTTSHDFRKQFTVSPILGTEWVNFRCPLEVAMHFIVSQYPDRLAKSNTEGYFYQNLTSYGW